MSSLNFNDFFSISTEDEFEALSLKAFFYQAEHNDLYKSYLNYLGFKTKHVDCLQDIPFMPIDFFKTHEVKTGNWDSITCFRSSGTTSSSRSSHHVKNESDYLFLAKSIFESMYGTLNQYVIIALLPSYLEQGDSSLIKMVNYFISLTESDLSGFYLGASKEALSSKIERAKSKSGRKVILFGVSYALLDLADEKMKLDEDTVIIETGGMKGRREELTRSCLHERLRQGLGVSEIHSEYGMTELMSQFYSQGEGVFKEVSSAKVFFREIEDPFEHVQDGKTGGINVIDLGNIHTCCFIETKDLGRRLGRNRFEVLGRFDNSDIRGCNLLYTS